MLLGGWVIEQKLHWKSVHQVIQNKIAHHPYVLKKDNLTVELHLDIHMGNHRKYKVNINDFWERSEKQSIYGLIYNKIRSNKSAKI